MIRDATFSDIPAIVALLQGSFMQSRFARITECEIDIAETKRLLLAAISRHGGTNGGATWIRVSVEPSYGQVCGLILVTLVRAGGILNRLSASDMFFLADPDAPLPDMAGLARGMVEWASANDKVIEIRVGTALMEDPMSAASIWSGLGFERCGEIWRMET